LRDVEVAERGSPSVRDIQIDMDNYVEDITEASAESV